MSNSPVFTRPQKYSNSWRRCDFEVTLRVYWVCIKDPFLHDTVHLSWIIMTIW